MIRRGLWLAAGAALGVAGYRKASQVTGAVRASLGRQQPGQQGRTGEVRGFLQDVGDGMAEYWDLHRGGLDRNLGGTGTGQLSAESRRRG